MIKYLLTLLFATSVYGAFPYHDNTGSFNATTNATGGYDAFAWNWLGYDDQTITVSLLPSGSTAVAFRMCYPKRGTVFVDSTNGVLTSGTNYTLSLARTDLPPDGIYFAEFLGYVNNITNVPARVLATGQINIQHSLFQNTSQSTWTNPLAGTVIGPPIHTLSALSGWPFLATNTTGYLNLLTNTATAAQGAKADASHGWGDHGTNGYITAEADTNANANLATHTGRVDNPHGVTYGQVGADAAGTASAATGTLAVALRGELAAGTGDVYAAARLLTNGFDTVADATNREYAIATNANAKATLGDMTALGYITTPFAWSGYAATQQVFQLLVVTNDVTVTNVTTNVLSGAITNIFITANGASIGFTVSDSDGIMTNDYNGYRSWGSTGTIMGLFVYWATNPAAYCMAITRDDNPANYFKAVGVPPEFRYAYLPQGGATGNPEVSEVISDQTVTNTATNVIAVVTTNVWRYGVTGDVFTVSLNGTNLLTVPATGLSITSNQIDAATMYLLTGSVVAVEYDTNALAQLALATNRIGVVETGKVDRVETNGWTVGPHLAWLTSESQTFADVLGLGNTVSTGTIFGVGSVYEEAFRLKNYSATVGRYPMIGFQTAGRTNFFGMLTFVGQGFVRVPVTNDTTAFEIWDDGVVTATKLGSVGGITFTTNASLLWTGSGITNQMQMTATNFGWRVNGTNYAFP